MLPLGRAMCVPMTSTRSPVGSLCVFAITFAPRSTRTSTVEQWVSLLRVERAGRPLPHPFADCAHWWELAHHTLRALETLHLLEVLHLNVAPDNICVPIVRHDAHADVAPSTIGLKFARLALIDFALASWRAEPFAEVSGTVNWKRLLATQLLH